MSKPQSLGYGQLTFRDIWEILRLPVLFALAAIAVTWGVWYLTSESCPPELAQTTGCNPSRIARYINLDALNKMATHAVIAAGGGGLWSYAMITRERKAREAAEEAREAALRQLAEEREQAAEERRQAAEERRQAAEERRQAAEERRQLQASIELLAERLAERENGSNGSVAQ